MSANVQNSMLFDWFSFTSKIDDLNTLKSLLGLDHVNWIECSGSHGYQFRSYFESISIHYGGNNDTYWVEMSGQGCRAYETYSSCCDWVKLFELILSDSDNYHLTRLDIAYDDWIGILDIDLMNEFSRQNNVVTKFRSYGVDQSYTSNDICLYYGSKRSDVLFRCYNKAAERNRDDVDHWIRFEIQLRNDRALTFISNLKICNYEIGTVFCGVLNNYLRFVTPSSDSHKDRWKICNWWLEFVGCASKISLWSKKTVDYNIYMLKNYVVNQAGNAIDCMIQLDGLEGFYDQVKMRNTNSNPKYQNLIDSILLERCILSGEGVPF